MYKIVKEKLAPRPDLLSKVVRCGVSQKKRLRDSTLVRPEVLSTFQPARPNFLSEWCSSGADTRKGGRDILCVFPFRPLD